MELSIQQIFGEAEVNWGNKHPHSAKLIDLWKTDRDYLIWAANLNPKRKCDRPIPNEQGSRIKIANLFESGDKATAAELFSAFSSWLDLSQKGIGIEKLERPSKQECQEVVRSCSLLAGHFDLDGIYSLATAISAGGALGGPENKSAFGKLRLLRYGFRNLSDYSAALQAKPDDVTVVIDYAAHPQAALTFDHHTTALSYWELGGPVPRGVFEPSMPSCPRLLATACDFDVPEDILTGCDLVDGALYTDVNQAFDLDNPFVALEYILSVDVSDIVAKKVILSLAANSLDPFSILDQQIWQTRLQLVSLELAEQRKYWSKASRYKIHSDYMAIADGRSAPYPATRFRYLPYENSEISGRPYLLTLRNSLGAKLNLGISRNPFFEDPGFFLKYPLNLGALAKTIGKGGGRQEASAVSIDQHDLTVTIGKVSTAIDESVKQS